MSDIQSLIAKLEAAIAADRELDLAIHVAIDPDGNIAHVTQEYPRGLNHQEGYAWDFYQKSIVYEKWTSDGRCPVNGGYPLPEYTALIDAAMTLVPQSDDPTWRWRIVEFQEWNKGNSYWFWRARISGWPNMRPVYECGEHPIPALALCIAALKSRDVTP